MGDVKEMAHRLPPGTTREHDRASGVVSAPREEAAGNRGPNPHAGDRSTSRPAGARTLGHSCRPGADRSRRYNRTNRAPAQILARPPGAGIPRCAPPGYAGAASPSQGPQPTRRPATAGPRATPRLALSLPHPQQVRRAGGISPLLLLNRELTPPARLGSRRLSLQEKQLFGSVATSA